MKLKIKQFIYGLFNHKFNNIDTDCKCEMNGGNAVLVETCCIEVGDKCKIKTKRKKYIGEFNGVFLPDKYSPNIYYIIKTDGGKTHHILGDSITSISKL